MTGAKCGGTWRSWASTFATMLVLRYLMDLSQQEIAWLLGIPIGTLRITHNFNVSTGP